MKIFTSKLTKLINNSVDKVRFLKTEPYPVDSFQMTENFRPKQSFWQSVRNFFGFRTKLNPKSFADGSHTPKVPFVASRQSVALSDSYLRTNYLSESDKIIDGFRDGGGGARFSEFGDCLLAKREVITIDRSADVYLRNAIKYVRENTAQMSENKKLKFIYNLVRDISGNVEKALERSQFLGSSAAGRELLLGKIFEHGAAACRHKALMFKILADEAGIKTRVIRGNAIDLSGFGRHAWNEVKLKNGTKLLVDIQNSAIVNLGAKNASKNPKLAGYYSENNIPLYYEID